MNTETPKLIADPVNPLGTTTEDAVCYAELRRWAKGTHSLEAAVEVLIRTGWAQLSRPWIVRQDHAHTAYADFAGMPDLIGAFHDDEQRLLRIIAALGTDDAPVALGDAVSGMTRQHLALVLAAIAHAAGSHEHSGEPQFDNAGNLTGQTTPGGPLYPWPTE